MEENRSSKVASFLVVGYPCVRFISRFDQSGQFNFNTIDHFGQNIFCDNVLK